MTTPAATTPTLDDREGVALLARVLAQAGYTAGGVIEALDTRGPFTRDVAEIPYHVRALPEGAPLTPIVKLFLLGLTVETEEAAGAFEPLTLERLEAMGLVTRAAGGVEPLVDVVPIGELTLASDRFGGTGLPERPDHVYGLTPPSRALASLTARRPVATALDLGTGSGMQALLAAAHSERVVGVDLNPRALRFAEFNALLNGFDNLELREGDLFDSVEGERFDLLVCNPPYAITPDAGSGYLFRDSDERGDRFCERLVRRVPDFLEEDGLGHVLVSWTYREVEQWSLPLESWVAGSGCDALLIRYSEFTPLGHAALWNPELRHDPEAYAETLDRWLEYYRSEGIERIGWGAVVLRRRTGSGHWVWPESLAEEGVERAGHHVLRVLANVDFLDALDGDSGLRAARLTLAPDHLLDRAFRFKDGAGIVDRAVLRLSGGLGQTYPVDLEAIQLLSQLDGSRTLGEAIAAARADEQAATDLARRLVELGFVVPA